MTRAPRVRPWDEILANARRATVDRGTAIADVFSAEELHTASATQAALDEEFDSLHALDVFDWTVSGVAGTLGALIDVFLVVVPRHPGFLGGKAEAGGWLSNLLKSSVGRLPEDKIRELEKAYRVGYDASTSAGLGTALAGMGPGTHRFQSLGHDPLLAWVFGVRDLLNGTFTAIGKDGRLIVRDVGNPLSPGEALYCRLFEALRLVAGHLASDIGTPRGLPAPLMPLLLFLQIGSVGTQGYTVGELSRQMYRSGYDFQHFLGSSVPVLVIEAIVRIAYFAHGLSHGSDLTAAVPLASDPKLRTQLLIAHSVAATVSAGKVCITRNPMTVSWSQWLGFFRYLVPQLRWLLIERANQRARHVDVALERQWEEIDKGHTELWKRLFGAD